MTRSIDVVIGDVHARGDALYSLLRELDLLDSHGRRRPGGRVIQVGDLLDRHADADANLETAQLAAEAVDIVLAGNHEWRLLSEADGDHSAALAVLAERGWPEAAAASDGWLVTHAGVHPRLAEKLPGNVDECVAEINRRWNRSPKQRHRDPLFSSVGPQRGGDDAYGGILWMHSSEWPKDRTTPWGQIAGHVPQPEPRLLPGPRWAIDIKPDNRLAAIVRNQGERRWRPLVVKAKARDRRALALAS